MKKISKLLACGCLAGAMVAGGFALSSCSAWTTTVSQGEYKYENPWSAGSYYGVKVSVEVQTDENGDRIRSVTIEDSDYTQASEGWEGRDNYLENEQTLLNAYRGKYVADVLAMKVTTDYQGQPSEVSDDSVLITDATQSSGRLLLAVQDALCNFGYSVFEGEYHYPNAWDDTAPDYGIRVRVVMKGNVVRKVAVISSGYTEVSSGWDGQATWTGNLDGLLSSYVGKTKTKILDETVTVSSGGQPDSVSDDSYVITGATQGSGRLLLAVQNALDPSGAQTTKVYTGEYHYANAWDSSAPDYGIRVAVKVKGGYILSVEVLDSDYVEVSEGWENANLWNDGLSNLLSKYAGKTVQEVLAVEVTTSESTPGQPEDISDQQYVIAGATQGSGRLLLAVQNALSVIEDNYARTFVGEYHYANPWAPTAPDYGIRVAVTVKGEDIVNVEVLESDYTEVSDGWNNANLWNDGLEGLLAAYESKTVKEVLAAYVTAQADGQPNVVSDADLMITGATQGSGRLLLAVQNALDPTGANTTKVYTGEYKYENTWVPGSYYGIKVAVTVKGETILKVEVLDSDYTEVTDSWEDKDIWINNLDSLLAAYDGKTVAEIFDVDVTVDGNGQPTAVSDSDLMISGATQGSGRLMLAVQNALSLLNPNPDEPEEPEEPENPYADWQYNEYIDVATTYTANSDGSVTYNIVTTANAPANAFEITIPVADGAITEYEITVNGSTSDHFAEIMSTVAKNMVGQTLEQLEAYLEGDEIQSGATRSNELCVNAGLFALANVDKATAAE